MRHGRLLVSAAATAVAALALSSPAKAATTCNLGPSGQIKHVIVLQFDNTHLARDSAGVPSDLEQIPALRGFLADNGSLLSNDHTILISHTAGGIVATETGLYPDRNGLNVTNSYEFFDKLASSGVSFSSAFKYWTDPTSASDTLPTLVTAGQKNTPAPWVAFTRAGCDFAGVGAADMELENTTSDVTQVFGTGSPEAQLGTYSAAQPAGSAGRNLAVTDLEGIAIHCSLQSSAPGGFCAGGGPDALPDEPGGYAGYKGLFGPIHVNTFLTGQPAGAVSGAPGTPAAPKVFDVFAPNATNTGAGAAPVAERPADTIAPPDSVSGATTSPIEDATGNSGFPGFDGMEANNALGYTAAMQEAGIPITYTYLSDVHDDHYKTNHGNAFGPGEAGMEAQLHEYDAAFSAFFTRLARDGIDKSNTLFLVTVDEGDHYSGGGPLNSCDGATVACQYDTAEAGGAPFGTAGFKRNVGEADVNLPALVSGTTGDTTTWGQDFDDAPTLLVPNQADHTGTPPGPNDAGVRRLERELGGISEFNPITGRDDKIADDIADQTEESILHMVNGDPNRTPTLTLFGDPDFFFQTSCSAVGSQQGLPNQTVTTHGPGCPAQGPGFAWNHGDEQPEIATTWQGWVGPGVQHLGQTGAVWTDHTDARPTLMTLLGLHDDYTWDGQPISQITTSPAPADVQALTAALKQIDAPFGMFGVWTLHYDTRALATDTTSDAAYSGAVANLKALQARRDALVPQIQAALAAGHGDAALLAQANALLADAQALANSTPPMPGSVGGTVPATLALTLGAPASFGAFTPGVDRSYTAATTANVISTAGDATLTASGPTHMRNGAFSLPDALQVTETPATWSAPVSNAAVAIAFSQHIGADDALRTGAYSATVTVTLSTTTP